jgi:two-component system, LytTR family, response regulator
MNVPMLRVLIADDEAPARDFLARLLAAHPDVSVVAACADGAQALTQIRQLRPDVVFMDVRMPVLGGLQALDALAADASTADAQPPLIVFCTAYSEYALRAFDYAAADYLLKPFDAERLSQTLGRLRARRLRAPDTQAPQALPAQVDRTATDARAEAVAESTAAAASPTRRLLVRDGERLHILPVDDLHWAQAEDKWLALHAQDGLYRLRKPIRQLEAELDPARFARIHRATLVALAQVRELHPLPDGDYGLVLRDGTVLNLSRTFRDAFFARLRAAPSRRP